MLDISTIILTYNEAVHIERCIRNAQRFSKQVFLVDSFSTDNTVALAESLGAIVYQHEWKNNHARQFNWGLQHLPIRTEWVFRLDADEYLPDDLIGEMEAEVPKLPADVTGVVFERKMVFMGKRINRGNVKWNMLRLFKYNKGFCEDRWMDEHIILTEGRSVKFKHYFVDDNLNPLNWWIQKHNDYSVREAIDLLNLEYHFLTGPEKIPTGNLFKDAAKKRKRKLSYAKKPFFWRSFLYFVYRYFFKLGFTEGKEGFLWHFLQGWWYRTLVDAKIYAIKKECGDDVQQIKKFIQEKYGIEL